MTGMTVHSDWRSRPRGKGSALRWRDIEKMKEAVILSNLKLSVSAMIKRATIPLASLYLEIQS
jgi:hypothetical protein